MSPKPDQQRIARDLYLHTDKSQTEIAEILNVNRKTIFLWIKKGRWEEMKIAAQQGPGTILQHLYDHVHEINKKIRGREDKCPFPAEVEMLRKLLGMTKNIAKKNTGFYMEAFEELNHFIAKKNRHLSHQVVKHMDEFVEGTFGDESFHMDKRVEENVAEVERNLAKKSGVHRAEIKRAEIKLGTSLCPFIGPTPEITNKVFAHRRSKFKENNRAQGAKKRGQNGAMMGQAVIAEPATAIISKPLTTNLSEEVITPAECPTSINKNIIENGASALTKIDQNAPECEKVKDFVTVSEVELPLSAFYAHPSTFTTPIPLP